MTDTKPTYLALGDSYTIGEGVKEEARWPVFLANKLNWQSPQIIATTGWTTSELLEGISKAQIASSYDWVSLLIGVNNQYRGQSLDSYQQDLIRLGEFMLPLVAHNTKRVFVISIPDYGITPFAKDKSPQTISSQIESFNQVKRDFARHFGFQYCDITQHSLKAEHHQDYLTDDQLHPSTKMYRLWVDEIIKTCDFS
ncbi:SGNH/GDSL hydrolase family protein [Catalinimonas sp. 4WD22]|uniref:SGNH/GDSL hydrolase family protein n=1 Tax=Catalinimonas locisalis TaxID=3133978 RepID=UPI0031019B7E